MEFLVPSRGWRIEPWHGGEGYRKGFYVARTIGGNNQWLQDSKGRARRFATEQSALAAIRKATGEEK